MPKPTWPVIASRIKPEYLEGTKCKICGEPNVYNPNDPAFKQLRAIYKHFKEKHSDIVEKVKAEVKKKPEVKLLVHVVFPKEKTEKETESEVENEGKEEEVEEVETKAEVVEE